MEITKFEHSCLLIKEGDKSVLIDPGDYTADSSTLHLESIHHLDALLITHEHGDHMYPPLIREIVQKFPNLTIIGNADVKKALGKEGINVQTTGNEWIEVQEKPHEKVFGNPVQIPNYIFKVFNKITHPGDSYQFDNTTPILALPLQAPWGSLTQSVEKAMSVKPQYILPIHDWHWKDQAREAFYIRLQDYFAKLGIKFIPLESGQPVQI